VGVDIAGGQLIAGKWRNRSLSYEPEACESVIKHGQAERNVPGPKKEAIQESQNVRFPWHFQGGGPCFTMGDGGL
jgi:hypothetical protein